MSQNYKIVETMRSDADEMEGWGAGNEAGRTRQAASLIQELGEALERCVDYIEADEMAHGRTFGAGVQGRAILSKLKEA
jgi:hypothetical protein